VFAPESPDPCKWRADYWDISAGSIYPINEVWELRLVERGRDWGARVYYITEANSRQEALEIGYKAVLNYVEKEKANGDK